MDIEEDKCEFISNEGDERMSGLAVNCNSPFISNKKELKGKPMSNETRERRDFIRNHKISISVDTKNMNMKMTVTEK